MTYLEFIKHTSNPLGVALFPSPGNLYFNHVRVGYLDFNRSSEAQEVNFFRPVAIPCIPGTNDKEEKELSDIVKQLTTLAILHDVPIRSGKW